MKTWTPNENITQVMLAFGPQDIEKFLPKWDLIPDEFKQGKNSWVAFIERWFYHGLECPPAAKEGVELKWALAHIMVILKASTPNMSAKLPGAHILPLSGLRGERTEPPTWRFIFGCHFVSAGGAVKFNE